MADNTENTTTTRTRTTRTAKPDEIVTVTLRKMHQAKEDNKDRVTPFHLDNGVVFYAPEGSGREYRLDLVDFLDKYELADDAA